MDVQKDREGEILRSKWRRLRGRQMETGETEKLRNGKGDIKEKVVWGTERAKTR